MTENIILKIVLLVNLWAQFSNAHEETKNKVELGDSIKLNCTTKYSHDEVTVKHWMIPHHLQLLKPGYEDEIFNVSSCGQTLTIKTILEDDLGIYFCYFHHNETNRNKYSMHNVFIHIPTILEVYKTNLLIGGISAGFFVVVVTILCIIDAYRWGTRKRNVEPEIHHRHIEVITVKHTDNGNVNEGYLAEEGYDTRKLRSNSAGSGKYRNHIQEKEHAHSYPAIGTTAM